MSKEKNLIHLVLLSQCCITLKHVLICNHRMVRLFELFNELYEVSTWIKTNNLI